jgi:hypothetical protein
MNLWSRLFGNSNPHEKRQLKGQIRHFKALNKITAASKSGGQNWPGIQTSYGDDSLNRAYLEDLAETQSRAQDIDVNNPDIHGFHRTRTAQVLGAGVQFKLAPHSSEVGLDHDALLKISQQVNRSRQIHSRLGGFDAVGLRRSEGKQQERAFLTALVLGSCLIHRVWRTDGRYKLPLSLELIPGSRISTPFNRMGDPKVSYGVEYSDEHRTRVVGWHIRRVSKTIGNSFIPDYEWDFIPVEDGSLLSLTEIAGIDRALPLSTSTVRMLRNRGEFLEAAVETARAQAHHYAVTECADGADPWTVAGDDADQTEVDGAIPVGFTSLGDVQMLYTANGEKVTWASAKLPEPDLPGFMEATDSRLSRGLVSSLSRFTRKVNSSWAGGRLEDQQDDPIIDQYRDAFISAWQVVNEWFLDAAWLASVVDLPGFNVETKAVWSEFRAQFPGKVHINPVDTMTAREKGYALRTTTPQRECESDGLDLRENLREWGQAVKMAREIEEEFELEEGTLDYLVSGNFSTATMGEEVEAEEVEANPAGEQETQPKKGEPKARRVGAFLNRLRGSHRE